MRIFKISFCLLQLFVTFNFHGMQKPPAKAPKPVVTADIKDNEDENAWVASLINLISKKVDPLGYASDNKAISYYHQALSYNPELEKPQKFDLGDTSKRVIVKIVPRIIAARKQLLEAVDSKNPDHKAIETLLELYRQVPQIFSECDCAILFGLHNWRRNAHKKSVHELNYYRQNQQSADQSKSVILDPKRSKQELIVNAVELRKLAEQKYNWWNPWELVAEGVHFVKKHYSQPIEHLTTVDSMKLCEGMAYFNPLHPLNAADPDFTLKPDLEWHRLLAKKVIGREDIYIANWAYNILNKRTANVMRMSQPVIATASSSIPSTIISPLTEGVANGYLEFIQNEKIDSTPSNPKEMEEKKKQEEEKKKVAEEESAKKKAEQEQEEKRKIELLQKREEEEKKKLECEIERRAQELAEKKITEELRIRLEAEAAFKADEEKKRLAREAHLKALTESADNFPSSSITPASAPGSPVVGLKTTHESDVPKLEQNPEDICSCKSGKKYKNCCRKKTISSGSPQRQ